MKIHIALLRAVNVGGRNMVGMEDLRGLFTTLGLSDARSLLQSGNLVFGSNGRTGLQLERLLEAETEKRLRLRVDYVVRTAKEWKEVIASNPFPREAKTDPSHLLVMFMKKAPGAAEVKALQAAIKGPEVVRSAGKQVYVTYPAGMGRSKLTPGLIEAKLGTRGTSRNWNTVQKLLALSCGDAP